MSNGLENMFVQAEEDAGSAEDRHYLGAIKIRLMTLYELMEEPNILEQISDEIDWINERLGIDDSPSDDR